MRRIFRLAFATAAFAVLAAMPVVSRAADDAVQTVRVALFDMSSMAGPGMGPGAGQFGIRGPTGERVPRSGPWSTPGQLPPGMMGPGWRWGEDSGPGWMAGHMMGPGMMGMGMMSLRSMPAKAKPGKIRFEVANYSASVVHEMEVVAVDDLNAPLPYDYNTAKVKIDKAKSLGEVEDIAAGEQKTLELTLPAGNYLLICNLPGHYAAGMVAPFTVTK